MVNLLTPKLMKRCHKIFKNNDHHNELIVCRKDFLEDLRSDSELRKYMDLPAVYIPSLDIFVKLKWVLKYIEKGEYN